MDKGDRRSKGGRVGAELRRARRLLRLIRATKSLDGLELALTPGAQWGWRGPMNGQVGRQRLVRWIGQQVEFAYAVETGTWRGSSTCFLADVLGCPIWTVEADPNAFVFSQRHLAKRDDVHTSLGDSRAFLEEQADLQNVEEPVFFYLDAHWDAENLPLWEEIRLVMDRWSQSVIMIDDFQVPHDAGYLYDDYGSGRELTAGNLRGLLPPGMAVLFPTWESAGETGAVRGCCVLISEGLAARLTGPMLRPESG